MNKNTLFSEKLNRMDLNLHTLSERSGVAYSTVYNLFTGKKSISDAKTDSLYRIAKALNMSMDELYSQFVVRENDSRRIMPDFTLMWEDEEIGSVHIGDKTVRIDRFDTHPAKQIFYADEIPRFVFGQILKNRCWDEHRPDIDRLLNMIGLDEYNPYEICKKTHGKMVQDRTWFRFEGEKLNFKDFEEKAYDTGY